VGRRGSGKSTLAKALVVLLGSNAAARVPADYYLRSRAADETPEAYLARPLEYDWALIDGLRLLPEGTEATTPAFDFSTFRRTADGGERTFVVRPVLVLDAMRLYPRADVRVLLTAAGAVRRARVKSRDRAGARPWRRAGRAWR
jgi:uridine kinase